MSVESEKIIPHLAKAKANIYKNHLLLIAFCKFFEDISKKKYFLSPFPQYFFKAEFKDPFFVNLILS
jgi:hypothetical protein